MGIRFGISAAMALGLLLFSAACASNDVERAFDSRTAANESNKVIIKYCMSCHTHQSFDAAAHVPKAQKSYTGSANALATECRVCHTYSVNWQGDEVRGTHWAGVKGP